MFGFSTIMFALSLLMLVIGVLLLLSGLKARRLHNAVRSGYVLSGGLFIAAAVVIVVVWFAFASGM